MSKRRRELHEFRHKRVCTSTVRNSEIVSLPWTHLRESIHRVGDAASGLITFTYIKLERQKTPCIKDGKLIAHYTDSEVFEDEFRIIPLVGCGYDDVIFT